MVWEWRWLKLILKVCYLCVSSESEWSLPAVSHCCFCRSSFQVIFFPQQNISQLLLLTRIAEHLSAALQSAQPLSVGAELPFLSPTLRGWGFHFLPIQSSHQQEGLEDTGDGAPATVNINLLGRLAGYLLPDESQTLGIIPSGIIIV